MISLMYSSIIGTSRNQIFLLAIMKTIKQSYNGYDIKDADMINKREVVTYIIRLRKSGKDVFATLNPEGRILYVK